MARSKALQAKEWQETIGSYTEARHLIPADVPSRSRHQTGGRRKKARPPQSDISSATYYENKDVNKTRHAEYRSAQRGLSDDDLNYVLLNGQIYHKAGAVLVHLRERDIPYGHRADQRCQKLMGTTVVLTRKGARRVLTVYRNRQSGPHAIKRKPDYGWPRKRRTNSKINPASVHNVRGTSL